MADLFTSEDVVERLGRSLTDTEVRRIDSLITDASASIRNYTRQHISEVINDVVQLKVRNGRIRLPQRPVTAVDIGGGLPGLFQWLGDDRLFIGSNIPDTFGWEPWRYGIRAITITYTHGYNPVPDDIIGVGCSIVLRAIGTTPEDGGLQSESIAGYSYNRGVAAAAGAFGMLQSERDVLDSYKTVGGMVQTAQPWII